MTGDPRTEAGRALIEGVATCGYVPADSSCTQCFGAGYPCLLVKGVLAIEAETDAAKAFRRGWFAGYAAAVIAAEGAVADRANGAPISQSPTHMEDVK